MPRLRRTLARHLRASTVNVDVDVQVSWLDATGTKPRSRRGGKRRGAGRPPKGRRAGSPHKERPPLKATTPVHITLRVVGAIGNLRKRAKYKALRTATLVLASNHPDCRIVHISVQRDHIHLLVEASNEDALARGMKAFQVSAAKRLNAALRWKTRRRGQVFTDRYHAEYITSPRQARNALAYVLNNWRKHREDLVLPHRPSVAFEHDWFSSGWMFSGWRERAHLDFVPSTPDAFEPLAIWFPRTWLLTTGWRRYGLISLFEVPSSNSKSSHRQLSRRSM
jgi:REP element-mobilizing transposase RayT